VYDRLAADAVLTLHLAFIAFVMLGGLLAFRWRWVPLLHLPAAAWGVFVEATGRMCPLTGLENALRTRAGISGYAESFVEHYVLPIVYPDGLTEDVQLALAAVALGVNLVLYGLLLRRVLRSPLRQRSVVLR
jgi:uncharacterized protein DUF2784